MTHFAKPRRGYSRTWKRAGALCAGVGLSFAMLLGGAAAANASSNWEIGTASCSGSQFSFSSATSTKSVTHYHEIPGEWKRSTKPSGYSNFYGWRGQGPVWVEISSSVNMASHLIGCRT